MDIFTETCIHKNNPTGASLVTVATGIACAPIDPLAQNWVQAYPIEKQYLMRQTFTEYTVFEAGDYLVADSTTYAIKAVHPYIEMRKMPAYYHLTLEQVSGS